jgi:DNA helicase-2/ATP-dependent DNA helicase PcrA
MDLNSLLNEPQREAVLHNDGPLLVLAGAGSGKTRVITYKIAWLVEQVGLAPWQILAVTFTNKAAGEMRERVTHLLGPDAKDVWLGTFHSIGLRLLRRHHDLVGRSRDFVVYDQDDREKLLKRVLNKMNVSKDTLSPRQVGYYIDEQKHLLRGPEHPQLPATTWIERLCVRAYDGYEKAKTRADAFDFSDLITRMVELLEKHPPVLSEWQYRWRYIMVDEFQDTDVAQYRLLKMLAGERANLCVVGDDDQSIYRWRGAYIQNILGFDKDFPERDVKVVRLEQNYRSTGNILKAASALIHHNTERHDKTLWTDQPHGDLLKCYQADSETGEARWVVRRALELRREGTKLSDMTIFYRTHSQSRVFEDALRGQATPYKVVGGMKFYERKEVKDILSYLRVVHNLNDDMALTRIINVPTRGIGSKTVERGQAMADSFDASLYQGLLRLIQTPEGSRSKNKIQSFVDLITRLREVAAREEDAFRVAEAVMKETGYIKRLQAEGTLEAETRKENIEELLLSIEEWRKRSTDRSLTAFLDHVALLTSLDEENDDADAITLMTVHAAKGLEFDTVFVTGLEEEVFPHFNSKEQEAVEEERRLMYVAVTRGKQRVFLSLAKSRQRFGRTSMNPPSRFLREIPKELLDFQSETGFRGTRFGATGGNSWAQGGRSAFSAAGGRAGGGASGSRGGWTGHRPPPLVKKERQDKHGRTLDYSDSQLSHEGSQADGLLGRTANHPRYGAGTIIRVQGQGGDARITVRFPIYGEKKIVARFLELE